MNSFSLWGLFPANVEQLEMPKSITLAVQVDKFVTHSPIGNGISGTEILYKHAYSVNSWNSAMVKIKGDEIQSVS